MLEGGISKAATMTGLSCSDGDRPAGDLIPWTVSNAFQNYDFPQFSGARVLRIATHPNAQGQKYGTRAMHLLTQYYSTNAHLASNKEMAKLTVQDDKQTMKVSVAIVDFFAACLISGSDACFEKRLRALQVYAQTNDNSFEITIPILRLFANQFEIFFHWLGNTL